jgi:hypothetical protein
MAIPEGFYSAITTADKLGMTGRGSKRLVYELSYEYNIAKVTDGGGTFYHLKTFESVYNLRKKLINKAGIIEIISLRNENKIMRDALVGISSQPPSAHTKVTIEKAQSVLLEISNK